MEIERETVLEIVAAVVPMVVMIAAVLYIGATYVENDALTATGGSALVAAITAFVFLMTGVGIWLARAKNRPDDGGS